MKNKMQDLRDHLFAQLERLGDDSQLPSKDEIDRARAMNEVAKTLIETARVEVDFLKVKSNSSVVKGVTSTFIEAPKPALPNGFQSTTTPNP